MIPRLPIEHTTVSINPEPYETREHPEPRNEEICMHNPDEGTPRITNELPRTNPPDLPLFAINTPLTSTDEFFIFRGRLGRYKVRILIDNGARGNFVSKEIREKLTLTTDTENPMRIELADRSIHLGFRVSSVPLAIGTYREKLEFTTAPITFDIILGLPRLIRYNPDINWWNRSLTFRTDDGHAHHLKQPLSPFDDEDPEISAKRLERLMKRNEH